MWHLKCYIFSKETNFFLKIYKMRIGLTIVNRGSVCITVYAGVYSMFSMSCYAKGEREEDDDK